MYLFRKSSLGGQVVWRVAVLSGIAITGLITAVMVAATVVILEVQMDTHTVADQAIGSMERFLVGLETDLNVTASTYNRTIMPNTLLQDILERNPAVLQVGVLDANGNVLHARQRVGHIDVTVLQAALVQGGNTGWGDVYTPDDNLPLIDFRTLVGGGLDSNAISGTMIATIDLSGLWDEVRGVSLPEGGYAYLASADGRLLVAPTITLSQEGKIMPSYNLADADTSRPLLFSQKIYRGLNGDRVFVETEMLNSVPWHFVIEQPVSNALSGLYIAILLTTTLIVAVLLVVASTGRFMFLRVVMPLNILRSYVEQFRIGNRDQRINLPRQSNDEIDALARTLNAMADKIDKRTEELLVARAEALESSRLKSEFLSTISHELRTPLNAIIGYCDLMLEGLAGDFDENTRRMLNRVNGSSDLLLNLINDLLDLSRIESGKLKLEMLPFEVRKLAVEIHDEHVLAAQERGLSFTIIIDSALPLEMYGDPNRIKQIVSNLVSNAIKFTAEGDVTVTLQQVKSEWLIRVQDTGVGIPQHSHRYIFDAFRQVDNSTTRVHGGTGLGLSIVRNLATMMGGRVSLESEVDAGSTFSVTLPLITRPADVPLTLRA
ncbi:MAG: ATP-binding protein [Chloroflexota bacterium]